MSTPARTDREARERRLGAAPDLDDVHRRQREEFGGLSWGSAFFGWLVAVGLATLLIALLSAAGTAVGLTQTNPDDAADSASTIGIVGGILLLAILAIAYYAGGYVAGRMARFNGPRQGVAVWVLGLIVTIVLAVAGVLLGAEYNVLESLNLPRIPVDEGSLTTGGLIALAAVLVGTLLAALAGGKAGSHYHRKVDRVGHSPTNGRTS
jgi:membrane protease YdiL (CAAX protease family)